MDTASIIRSLLQRESAHQFFNSAMPDERLQAREHVKKFIATERGRRDSEIAGAEAELADLRKAVAAARATLARAEVAERGAIDRINRARKAFDTTAGVLEHRLDEYDPTHRNTAEVVA